MVKKTLKDYYKSKALLYDNTRRKIGACYSYGLPIGVDYYWIGEYEDNGIEVESILVDRKLCITVTITPTNQ